MQDYLASQALLTQLTCPHICCRQYIPNITLNYLYIILLCHRDGVYHEGSYTHHPATISLQTWRPMCTYKLSTALNAITHL